MASVDTRWLGADGTSAPFFAAAGIAPSKDNWWSTPDQPKPRTLAGGPTPCDGGNRNVTNNFLHALVATLSTGPVGFSDALGYTNATLVRSTCASDGLLLKPSLQEIGTSIRWVPGTRQIADASTKDAAEGNDVTR